MVRTVCPGSSDPFYILSYYIKWVTTSWTHSIYVHFRRAPKTSLTFAPDPLYPRGQGTPYITIWRPYNLFQFFTCSKLLYPSYPSSFSYSYCMFHVVLVNSPHQWIMYYMYFLCNCCETVSMCQQIKCKEPLLTPHQERRRKNRNLALYCHVQAFLEAGTW